MSANALNHYNFLIYKYNNFKKTLKPASEMDSRNDEIFRDETDLLITYVPMISRGFRSAHEYIESLDKRMFITKSDIEWIKQKFLKMIKTKNFGVYKAYYKFKSLIKTTSFNDSTIMGDDLSNYSQEQLISFKTNNYKKVFTFSVKNLIRIIESSLVSVREGCCVTPDPKKPRNPYNRKQFNYFDYMKIWIKFSKLNIKSTIFQLFKQADFSIDVFKKRNIELLFNISLNRFFSTLDEAEYEEYYKETMEYCRSIYDRTYPNRMVNNHFNKWKLCYKCINEFDKTKFLDLVKKYWLFTQSFITSQDFLKWMRNFFKCNTHFLTEKTNNSLCMYHMYHSKKNNKSSFIRCYKHLQMPKYEWGKSKKMVNGVFNFTGDPFSMIIGIDKHVDVREELKINKKIMKKNFNIYNDLINDIDCLVESEDEKETRDNLMEVLEKNKDFFDKINERREYLIDFETTYEFNFMCQFKKFKEGSDKKESQRISDDLIDCLYKQMEFVSIIKKTIQDRFNLNLDLDKFCLVDLVSDDILSVF